MKIVNSCTFINEAKGWIIGPSEIQVSYDVVALYPSVPRKKATTIILELHKNDHDNLKSRTIFNLKHIKSMIDLCMENSYFIWNDQIRGLVDSGPIGLSLMVVMAEGFLQVIERNAINIALSLPKPVAPITHRRYVDDTHDRFNNKDESEEFLKILNSQEPRIQFEPEYEDNEKSLHFLDCTLINNGKGQYETTIYRKNAITNVQVKSNSCHDEKVKYGIFKGFIHRANAICTKNYIDEEIQFLIDVFVENGYKRDILESIAKPKSSTVLNVNNNSQNKTKYVSLPFIPVLSYKLKRAFSKAGYKTMFKSGKNLQSILTSRNKPKLPPNSYPGTYRIPCSCDSRYIGMSGKKNLTRFGEHEKAIFNGKWKDSALADHTRTCTGNIDWDKASTISTEPHYFQRCVREALEIQKEQVGPRGNKIINKENGQYVTTNTWINLLKKINKYEK